MEGTQTAPGLPAFAYAEHPATGETIVVKRGKSGYYPANRPGRPDELNARLGVTPAQAEAMLTGSIFGWDVPGADPAIYDEAGRPLHLTPARRASHQRK